MIAPCRQRHLSIRRHRALFIVTSLYAEAAYDDPFGDASLCSLELHVGMENRSMGGCVGWAYKRESEFDVRVMQKVCSLHASARCVYMHTVLRFILHPCPACETDILDESCPDAMAAGVSCLCF